MIKLSGVVMTFNEEANIARCLRSMKAVAEELVVVDSFSTDRTVEIAREQGARVIQRPYPGYAEQRRFLIETAGFDHVLPLDADEALSDELAESILQVKANWTRDCFWCNRLSRVGDHWIRHGAYYPDRKMRLFKKGKYQITGINPHDKIVAAPGATEGRLNGDILHYAYRDLAQRSDKMNGLSSHAARAYAELGKRGNWFRLLFKPGIRFFIEYLVRGGFRDGFYGYAIARTSAQYVFLREAKLMEIQRYKPGKETAGSNV